MPLFVCTDLHSSEDYISLSSLAFSVDDKELNIDAVKPEVDTDNEQHDKLQMTDLVDDHILYITAENMFPSIRKQLALGPLKLGEEDYKLIQNKGYSLTRSIEVIGSSA